jgi:RimJ/RimL family protein N-acetyltransferase
MTLKEANEWVSTVNESWKSETAANWAVTERGELVGRMSLRTVDLEDGLAGIGYWVVPAARGRGIAPRALVAVSDWAINELGLHRLELEHSTRNQASCRVAERPATPWRAQSAAKHCIKTGGMTCICTYDSISVGAVETRRVRPCE